MKKVVITTDGSVSKNGKPDAIGGWAAILQALQDDMSAECSKCDYKGNLDEFEDTEHDGDVWGTCPKCHKNAMLYMNEEPIVVNEKEICGKLVYETDSCPITNNRAEMYGILKGLEEITGKNCTIEVNSDSELCIKTLNGEYSRKTNQDLWERLDKRCEELKQRGCSIKFVWVRGHNGHILNERCDKLASKAKKAVPHGTSLVVKAKKGLMCNNDKTCKCCGKVFYVSYPGEYVFKKETKWYCTYTCFRKGK